MNFLKYFHYLRSWYHSCNLYRTLRPRNISSSLMRVAGEKKPHTWYKESMTDCGMDELVRKPDIEGMI